MIRLDKYLADMGAGTRQEVKRYIRQGRVAVDGETVKTPDMKVDADRQSVSLDGARVEYAEYEYYMMNKPAGVVSATEDARERTVLDLLADRRRKDLFPAGRLDKDTEGLLLITNDGALAHRLLSPGKHVDKCYFVRAEGRLTAEAAERLTRGVNIGTDAEPEITGPADLTVLREELTGTGPVTELYLTIREGRYHQVKRMLKAAGCRVLYLKRVRMGSLMLDTSLRPGEYRRLTEEELKRL